MCFILTNVDVMLGYYGRWWTKMKIMIGQRLVFAVYNYYDDYN